MARLFFKYDQARALPLTTTEMEISSKHQGVLSKKFFLGKDVRQRAGRRYLILMGIENTHQRTVLVQSKKARQRKKSPNRSSGACRKIGRFCQSPFENYSRKGVLRRDTQNILPALPLFVAPQPIPGTTGPGHPRRRFLGEA